MSGVYIKSSEKQIIENAANKAGIEAETVLNNNINDRIEILNNMNELRDDIKNNTESAAAVVAYKATQGLSALLRGRISIGVKEGVKEGILKGQTVITTDARLTLHAATIIGVKVGARIGAIIGAISAANYNYTGNALQANNEIKKIIKREVQSSQYLEEKIRQRLIREREEINETRREIEERLRRIIEEQRTRQPENIGGKRKPKRTRTNKRKPKRTRTNKRKTKKN